MSKPVWHRRIRSFVRREGRLTPAQQRALELLWPRFGIDNALSVLDLDAIFGRQAPHVLPLRVAAYRGQVPRHARERHVGGAQARDAEHAFTVVRREAARRVFLVLASWHPRLK